MNNNADFLRQDFFVCECGDLSHQFVVSWYPNYPDEDHLYIDVHLATFCNFWRRLWIGLKYAFGCKSRFGEFDDIVLDSFSVKKLRNTLDEFLKSKSSN